MEARPCQILEFFDGTKQLLVPLFQRPYEWGTKEWEVLWADLLEQYEHTEEEAIASHWACTRFRRHRVRCFYGTGGESWRDDGLRESSSLKRCG